MNSIIIEDRLYPQETSNYKLEILAYWFTDDVRNHAQGWIEWLNDDRYEDTDSNATWLEKYKGNIILGNITDWIQAKNPYKPKEEDVIKIPKENVIELLNTWEQLLKTRPKEIMITEENGVFKMFEVQ